MHLPEGAEHLRFPACICVIFDRVSVILQSSKISILYFLVSVIRFGGKPRNTVLGDPGPSLCHARFVGCTVSPWRLPKIALYITTRCAVRHIVQREMPNHSCVGVTMLSHTLVSADWHFVRFAMFLFIRVHLSKRFCDICLKHR